MEIDSICLVFFVSWRFNLGFWGVGAPAMPVARRRLPWHRPWPRAVGRGRRAQDDIIDSHFRGECVSQTSAPISLTYVLSRHRLKAYGRGLNWLHL